LFVPFTWARTAIDVCYRIFIKECLNLLKWFCLFILKRERREIGLLKKNKTVFLVALVFSVILLVNPVASSPSSPVASFTYTPSAPIFGQVIIFNASASYDPDGGNISSYGWDFDDGTVYTVDEPVATHNYTSIGDYNVTLTVTDDEAETDTIWQIVKVREYPIATFTYLPESPVESEIVTLNASLSTAVGGTIMNYTWDFDDGNITTVTYPVITHIYTAFGNYNVTLTVADDEGLTDAYSESITVRGYPTASFTHSPDRPHVNENVTFNASSSTANGGTIVGYEWDFDDGSNATGEIVIHKYTTIGNYNVTLAVTDSENLKDSVWTIVTVRKFPFATFTYSPAAPLVAEIVTFNASLSTPDGGTIMNYTWDFDDGNITTVTYPVITHIYTAFGNYNVTLTIADSEDLTDDFSDTVRILVAPTADFNHSPIKPIIDQTIIFNASASYDPDRSILSYRWDFDDGNITTLAGAVITHAYTTEGTYNVTLTVTDDDGLNGTIWKLITVYTFLYVHDVAIISVATSAPEVYVGQVVNITVVAKNEGTAVETFSVTAYYDVTSVGTKMINNLLPNEQTTLTFSWNTTGNAPGNYATSAQASVVPEETDTSDNTLTNGSVKIKIEGDVNGDNIVDGGDQIMVGNALWSNLGDPTYNPYADVNYDGSIDGGDQIVVGNNLWESWP
jgi:PKD repeat protein